MLVVYTTVKNVYVPAMEAIDCSIPQAILMIRLTKPRLGPDSVKVTLIPLPLPVRTKFRPL